MTVTALTGLVPEWYTPDDEKGSDTPAEFKLVPLTTPQMAQVQTHFDMKEERVKATGLYLACEFGLRGWKNVIDHEGNELKFSRSRIATLAIDLAAELGGQIIASSLLSGDDEKNL